MEKRSYRLEMQGISKRFGGTCALNNVSIKVKPGEIHALIGENGAGKSTLIKILSGAYIKDEGEIFINGQLSNPLNIDCPQCQTDIPDATGSFIITCKRAGPQQK